MRLRTVNIALFVGLGLMSVAHFYNCCSTDGLMKTGVRYIDSHKYVSAVKQFNKVLERDITNIEAYENRGEANMLLGNYKAALIDYSNILRFDPNNAGAYCGLATAYEKLGYVEEALAGYGKSIELDPGFAIAYNNRAVLKEKLGDPSYVEDHKKAAELGFPKKQGAK